MQSSLGTNVGGIFYSVSLDTKKMVDEQRRVDAELQKTTKSLDGFEAKLSLVTQAVKAYAAALFVISQSDAYTKLSAQLKLATDNSRQFERAQQDVRAIAKEAQTDISGVGTLYARITSATKELGVSQSKVSDITRTVALALKVSGAGAAESASATLQLSQAFAAGALRGEEFNSVSEAAPRLMQALADGIGVPRGQLRALAEDGKLTSAVLAEALPKALKDLEAEAAQVQTISGAFQELRNEVMLFIGEQTNASGAAKLLAQGIGTLAANIDTLAAAALGYAATKLAQTMLDVAVNAARSAQAIVDNVAAHRASIAAQQAARTAAIAETAAKVQQIEATLASITAVRADAAAKLASANASAVQAAAQIQAARSAGALSFAIAALREGELLAAAATKARSAATAELAALGVAQARATAALTAAQTASTAAMTATTTATSLAGRALGLLGGPIGIITTVLGLGVTAWALWGGAAKDAEQKAADAVERSTDEIVSDLDRQIAKLKERNALRDAGLGSIAKQETEAAKKLATLQGQINNLMAGKGVDGGAALPEAARVELLQVLLRQYGTLAGKIQAVGVEQDKLSAAGTASKLDQWMLKYATDAEKAAAEIEKVKKELNGVIPPELEQRIKQKFMPDKKPAKDSFDDLGYLSGLQKQVATPFEQINLAEEKALRENAELLRKGNLTRAAAAEAATLIEEAAAQQRSDLLLKEAGERYDYLTQAWEKEKSLKASQDAERKQGQALAQGIIGDADPIVKLEQELATKSELLLQAYMRDQANEQLYAQARVALEQETAAKIKAIKDKERADQLASQSAQLQAFGQLFDGMAGLTQAFAGKQSSAYRAMFAVSKAFAIADATVKLGQAIMNANFTAPWPTNFAAMATVAAAGGNVLTSIKGATFGGGRQYGGPVDSGSMYRVGEGNRPEMFVGDSGRSYMIPGERGKVIGNGDLGGGGNVQWTIVVNNTAPGATASVTSIDDQSRTVTLAVSAVAEQISSNSGPVWSAMRGATNVQSRLG